MNRCWKTKRLKFGLAIKALAVTIGVLAAFSGLMFYSPKAAADDITDTDLVFTEDTRKSGSADTQFVIPIRGGGYNYINYCNNDGTVESTAETGSYTCFYATPAG